MDSTSAAFQGMMQGMAEGMRIVALGLLGISAVVMIGVAIMAFVEYSAEKKQP